MSRELKNKWSKDATKAFQGKTVARIRYLTQKEQDDMGWYEAGPVILFTDGSYMMASQGDEMNGPGSLATSDPNIPIIPVIR